MMQRVPIDPSTIETMRVLSKKENVDESLLRWQSLFQSIWRRSQPNATQRRKLTKFLSAPLLLLNPTINRRRCCKKRQQHRRRNCPSIKETKPMGKTKKFFFFFGELQKLKRKCCARFLFFSRRDRPTNCSGAPCTRPGRESERWSSPTAAHAALPPTRQW